MENKAMVVASSKMNVFFLTIAILGVGGDALTPTL
jgi:hypothetical protein